MQHKICRAASGTAYRGSGTLSWASCGSPPSWPPSTPFCAPLHRYFHLNSNLNSIEIKNFAHHSSACPSIKHICSRVPFEFACGSLLALTRCQASGAQPIALYLSTRAPCCRLNTIPVFVSVLTFTVYVLLGNNLTAAKAFTALSLFTVNTLLLSLSLNWVTQLAFKPSGIEISTALHMIQRSLT